MLVFTVRTLTFAVSSSIGGFSSYCVGASHMATPCLASSPGVANIGCGAWSEPVGRAWSQVNNEAIHSERGKFLFSIRQFFTIYVG